MKLKEFLRKKFYPVVIDESICVIVDGKYGDLNQNVSEENKIRVIK